MDEVRREKAQLEQVIEHEHIQLSNLKKNGQRKEASGMAALSESPEEGQEEDEEED